jgi:hypothetical protein
LKWVSTTLKVLNVLRNLKKYKYDDKRIVAEFSTIGSMKKLKGEIDNNRRGLEDRIKKCKDVLPLAEQLMRLNVSIGERSIQRYMRKQIWKKYYVRQQVIELPKT